MNLKTFHSKCISLNIRVVSNCLAGCYRTTIAPFSSTFKGKSGAIKESNKLSEDCMLWWQVSLVKSYMISFHGGYDIQNHVHKYTQPILNELLFRQCVNKNTKLWYKYSSLDSGSGKEYIYNCCYQNS